MVARSWCDICRSSSIVGNMNRTTSIASRNTEGSHSGNLVCTGSGCGALAEGFLKRRKLIAC